MHNLTKIYDLDVVEFCLKLALDHSGCSNATRYHGSRRGTRTLNGSSNDGQAIFLHPIYYYILELLLTIFYLYLFLLQLPH